MPQRLDVTPDELEKMMSLPYSPRCQRLPVAVRIVFRRFSAARQQQIGKELNRMALKVAGIQEEKGGKKKFSLFS